MQECDIAVELYRRGIILTGTFRLASGIQSPIYVDMRKALSYPELYLNITALLVAASSKLVASVDAVVGLATAGIPWATMIASWFSKPFGYVRVERKEHGTMSKVEGDLKGRRVVVIDDVATTGSSLAKAVAALREAEANPTYALVIVDRCQGATEKLESLNVKLYTLYTLPGIVTCLTEKGLIDRKLVESLAFSKCAPRAVDLKWG